MTYIYIKPYKKKDEEEEERLKPSQIAGKEQKDRVAEYQYIKPYREEWGRKEPEKPKEKKPAELFQQRVLSGEAKRAEPIQIVKPSFIDKIGIGAKKIAYKVKETLFGYKEERKAEEEVTLPEGVSYDQIVGGVWEDKVNTEKQLEDKRKELQNLELKLPKFRQAGADKDEARLEREIFAMEKTIKNYNNFLTREPARRGMLQEVIARAKDPADLLKIHQIKETKIKRREEEVMAKYERGENLTDEEMIYYNHYRAKTLDSYIDRGVGIWAGDVIAEMPNWLMEIAVMSNLAGTDQTYTQLGTGFSNTLKISNDTARKIVTKVTTNSVKKAVASQYAIPTIEEKTAEYMLPAYEIQMGVDGKDFLKLVKPGFDEEAAISKAYASNMIEYISEGVGDYIDDAVPFVKKLFISKWLKNKGATTPNIATALLKKFGINSIVSEVIEEEIAEPAQSYIDERDYKDPFFTPEGRERLLVEFLGMWVFQGTARVPTNISERIKNRRRTMPGDKFSLKVDMKADIKEKEAPPAEKEVEKPPLPKRLEEEIKKREVEKKEVKPTEVKEEKPIEAIRKPIESPIDLLVSHEGAPDKKQVEIVKKQIKEGKAIVPIKVIREGEKYGIEDGKHRYQAYKELGYNRVPIELVTGEKAKKPEVKVETETKPVIKPKQTEWIIDQIYNNEDSPEGMKKYLMEEGKISEEMADLAVETRTWVQKQAHVVTHDELADKLTQSLIAEKEKGKIVVEKGRIIPTKEGGIAVTRPEVVKEAKEDKFYVKLQEVKLKKKQ